MNWQPIETAPKDRRILLFFPGLYGGYIATGEWEADQYVKKPRPFWTCDCERWMGRTTLRGSPPTHWCEITMPNEPTR